VSITPLWPTPQIQLCKLGSKAQKAQPVADTAVSMTALCQYDSAVPGDLEFERLWLPLKGISIKK
jgi:hypothetical protein